MRVNCTSSSSHPAPHLKWFINGKQVQYKDKDKHNENEERQILSQSKKQGFVAAKKVPFISSGIHCNVFSSSGRPSHIAALPNNPARERPPDCNPWFGLPGTCHCPCNSFDYVLVNITSLFTNPTCLPTPTSLFTHPNFQVYQPHLYGPELTLDLRCTSSLMARVAHPDQVITKMRKIIRKRLRLKKDKDKNDKNKERSKK